MKRKAHKQLLSMLDEPVPIPATLYNMDLANAIETFKPGTHSIQDIPERIPVYDRATGKIERFVKTKPASRRSVSMPNVSRDHGLMSPKAPPVPPKEGRRAISCFLRGTEMASPKNRVRAPSVIEEEEENALPSLGVVHSLLTPQLGNGSYGSFMTGITPTSTPDCNLKSIPSCATGTISSQDDLHDDLFSDMQESNYASSMSSANAESSQGHESCARILDVVEDYVSDSSSILSSNYQLDLRSDITNSKLNIDTESFIDSLFGSEASGGFTPSAADKAAKYADKQLPAPPTQRSNEQPLMVAKVRKNRKQIPPPRSSLVPSNQSVLTFASTATSLKDSKKELEETVRQRPFSYCLDPGMDYTYSPYKAIEDSKRRVQSQKLSASSAKPRLASSSAINSTNPKQRSLTLGSPVALVSHNKEYARSSSSAGWPPQKLDPPEEKGYIQRPPSTFYRNVSNPQAVFKNMTVSKSSPRSASKSRIAQPRVITPY